MHEATESVRSVSDHRRAREPPVDPNSSQLYYSLASDGHLRNSADPTSDFLAASIWISTEAWDETIIQYQTMIHKPKISKCPG